jgi:nucleoside-diphosphate-sugar epimerase
VRFAIVGANGQVGAELCFLFRKDGLNVVPIVRNRISAIFLDYHGFECRIAEIANQSDARSALSDIDVVVVAALAFASSRGHTRRSRRVNDEIMRNSVKFCKEHAKIVYLSSIAAFSSKVDEHTPKFHVSPPYDVEKRRGENTLFKSCKNEGKIGYALRLGHVFGRNQTRFRNIIDLLTDRAEIHVQVSPDRLSNVLHVPTLKEAIMICAESDLKPGTYSVVNCPQWTWGNVYDYYRGSTDVVFHGDPEKRRGQITRKMSQAVYRFMHAGGERRFGSLRLYLPNGLEEYLRCKYLAANASLEVKELVEASAPMYLEVFGYRPIPGPFIQGLSKTETLLKGYDASGNVFDAVPVLPLSDPLP